MTHRVRNKVTGLVHDVPAGHPALTDGGHDIIPERAPPVPLAPEPPVVTPPVQPVTRPSPTKKAKARRK